MNKKMINPISRRQFVQYLALLGAIVANPTLSQEQAPVPAPLAPTPATNNTDAGNFAYIYRNPLLREEFFTFLVNVFHLYPEQQLQQLIQEAAEVYNTDQNVYRHLQSKLTDIKPFLGELTFALPALNKQKATMAAQTLQLLDNDRRYEGYLEIGSTGRYVDPLEEEFNIVGERYFVAEKAPSYSLSDMIDRNQIYQAGPYIPLADYRPDIGKHIANNSLDLVTVFIGLHHCPIPLREEFLSSIRDTMKPGAYMVIRDHDARNTKMRAVVGLAHDVFNMGTEESWEYNAKELRHFYSLSFLDTWLSNSGFVGDGRRLYQAGDPTHNALMVYRKA
ncbi:MAG: class I SAM-dependent methyltransferase [Zhongshania sp.]|uniref:class I SAM-dependent methyltransferase n=1 Tax=Zhongshania sp. TaxID=1971902 RepID=UPI0026322B21|nr:class I SAM-dependent methyltransferase [Zhongshania sp.]MDF1690863.1 class I SAM-dependent methyltransferase [Zhongshania sp.]